MGCVAPELGFLAWALLCFSLALPKLTLEPTALKAVSADSVKGNCLESRPTGQPAPAQRRDHGAYLPPCPLQPARGQGSIWASALSAQGSPVM